MKTIVLKVYPAASHLNATFKLARQLSESGYRVVYAGSPDVARLIAGKGFEFYLLDQTLLPGPIDKHIDFRVTTPQAAAAYRDFYLAGEMFDKLVADLKPGLFLLDVPYINYSLFLQKHNVPLATLQTKVTLDKGRGVPPIDCDVIPRRGLRSFLAVELAWLWYFLGRGVVELKFWLKFGGISELNLLRKAAKATGGKLGERVKYRRSLHIGLRDVPELILSPQEFDFPRTPVANQYYVGPSVEMDRTETGVDAHYYDTVAYLAAQKRGAAATPKVVYCALGSMSGAHYNQFAGFFRKVIGFFEGRPDCVLILATGTETKPEQLGHLPANVHVFNKVPQLHVLTLADAMITHAGMQSVSECILSGVPVLAYPLNLWLDQRGNAARAVYHGIGLAGNFYRDSAAGIAGKLTALLGDDSYKRNVNQMRRDIHRNNRFSQALPLIRSLLKEAAAPVAAGSSCVIQ